MKGGGGWEGMRKRGEGGIAEVRKSLRKSLSIRIQIAILIV
jgi:hypothetical protein